MFAAEQDAWPLNNIWWNADSPLTLMQVSEGIDFSDKNARIVVSFWINFLLLSFNILFKKFNTKKMTNWFQ